MKTKEQLKAEYESALERLDKEEQLRAALSGKGLNPSMVHQSRLYGSAGSVVFGDSFERNADKVSLEQLRDLLRELPPLPQVLAKGTFTRFVTEQFADSDANKERGREEVTAIFPVTLKTSSVASYSVKAEWFTEINGAIWSVDAYLENPHSVARVEARRVEFRGGHRYEDARLTISPTLNPPDGGYWQRVCWARGSDEYPNDFTAYHTQYDDDPVTWIERALTPETQEVS